MLESGLFKSTQTSQQPVLIIAEGLALDNVVERELGEVSIEAFVRQISTRVFLFVPGQKLSLWLPFFLFSLLSRLSGTPHQVEDRLTVPLALSPGCFETFILLGLLLLLQQTQLLCFN